MNPLLPPGTRITPDQIEPDVGELYRHRETGEIIRVLSCSKTSVNIQDGFGIATLWKHDFWDRFLHAKARQ